MSTERLPVVFVVDLGLLLLPIVACVLLGQRLGVRDKILLLLCGYAGGGLLGFAIFWAYLLNTDLGRGFALAVTAGSAIVLLDACRNGFAGWRRLRIFAPVSALYAATGLFNLALGYLHGGFNAAVDVPENRYLVKLPADTEIPLLFARQLQSHVRPLPYFVADNFQSSDRPPLQTDYYLLQQAVLGSGRFHDYQVMSTLLQGLWVFGLWALLRAARKPRWSAPVCLAVVLFNGFVIQNSFFVWPKLVSGAGVMLAAAAFLTGHINGLRASRLAGGLAGAVLAVAILGHPGTMFALAGAAPVLVLLWRVPRLRPARWEPTTKRFLGFGVLTLGAVYVPWSLYQKFYQPPANTLLEVQLANSPISVPGESTGRVVIDAYRKAGAHGTVANKLSNFAGPFHHTLGYLREVVALPFHVLTGNTAAAQASAHAIVDWQFFYIAPIAGLAGMGLIVLCVRTAPRAMRRHAHEALPAEAVWVLCVLVTYVLWALTLFGPNSTSAHQGTYFMEPVLIAAGILGFWSVSPRLAVIIGAASCAITLWLYIGFTPVVSEPRAGIHGGITTAAAISLVLSIAACLVCLWWVGIWEPNDDPSSAQGGPVALEDVRHVAHPRSPAPAAIAR